MDSAKELEILKKLGLRSFNSIEWIRFCSDVVDMQENRQLYLSIPLNGFKVIVSVNVSSSIKLSIPLNGFLQTPSEHTLLSVSHSFNSIEWIP